MNCDQKSLKISNVTSTVLCDDYRMADWIPLIETNRNCDLCDILQEKFKDTKGKSEALIRSTDNTMDKGEE